MSAQAEGSPSPTPSLHSDGSDSYVEFINLVTGEGERASSFHCMVPTLREIDDENHLAPFVRRKPVLKGHLSGGVRAVILYRKNIHKLFNLPHGAKLSNQLILYEYEPGWVFWVLNAGPLKIIVQGNGGGFRAWLGPEKEFSKLKVAHPKKIYKTIEGGDGDIDSGDDEHLSAGGSDSTGDGDDEDSGSDGADRAEDGQEQDLGENGVGGSEDGDNSSLCEHRSVGSAHNEDEYLSDCDSGATGYDKDRTPTEEEESNDESAALPQSAPPNPIVSDGKFIIRSIRTGEVRPASYFYKLPETLARADPSKKLNCMTQKGAALRRHPSGFVEVGLFKAEIQQRFGVSQDQVVPELTLYQYGNGYVFWTLRVGDRTVIVKGHGKAFRAWLGPGRDEGYSNAVTTSGLSGTPKGVRVSDSIKVDPDLENADGGQKNANGEEDGQANFDGTTLNLDTVDAESKDGKPTNRALKRPVIFGEAAATSKRAKISKAEDYSGSRLSYHKLHGTKLYISVSTNDYGPVPVNLRSCQTIGTFFSMVLKAWDLEGKENEIKAIKVQFGWKPEKPMVVKENVPDSFDNVLKNIDEAPCWDEGGDGKCEVDVLIIMV